MAGYTIKQVTMQNFKYIPNDNPITIDFQNSNIVILDGQNGYGKTTLFDALELLLSGFIKHFNADLLNRGTESIGILANDVNKDIVVIAWLSSPDFVDVKIERRFVKEQDFSSIIFWNESEITQDKLYSVLKTGSNMFDIGTYIYKESTVWILLLRKAKP